MKILRSRFANVIKDGERVHTQVRVLEDTTGRMAVFASKTQTGPLAVYAPGEVVLETVSAPGCMCKESSQAQLARVWERSEQVTV